MGFDPIILTAQDFASPVKSNYADISRYSGYVPEAGYLEGLDFLRERLSGANGMSVAILGNYGGKKCSLALAYQCKQDLAPSPLGKQMYVWKFACRSEYRQDGILESMCDILTTRATPPIQKLWFDASAQVRQIAPVRNMIKERKFFALPIVRPG